ncbi:MAG: hypothetical protein D6799_06330 [Bacteroidetes bacterium]|nr:MAG: hypothetical protein D6799_06330 [Bacteroidota bacterium]
MILHEKESPVPANIKDKTWVLDEFCDLISILSRTWFHKRVYLVMKRRRWKEAGNTQQFSNTYTLHPEDNTGFEGLLKKTIEASLIRIKHVEMGL